MPNRMLRDWTDSLKLEKIPATAERLFVRIIMKADDYGRFHADPRLVRAACFPLEDCGTKAVESDLQELAKRGLIYVYTVEERDYLAVVNYGQRLKQSRPKFPPEDGSDDEWKPTSGNFRELPPRSRIRREVEVEENTNIELTYDGVVYTSGEILFEKLWEDYGCIGARKKASAYWRKLAPDQMQGICDAMGPYLRVVAAGRRQKDFEGWINPANEIWAQDWEAQLAEWSKDDNKSKGGW
jgi:hypothetical protein